MFSFLNRKKEIKEPDLIKEKQFRNSILFHMKNGSDITIWVDNWKPLEAPFEHAVYTWSRILEWYFSYKSDWKNDTEVKDEDSIYNDPYVTYKYYLYKGDASSISLNRNEIINFRIILTEIK